MAAVVAEKGRIYFSAGDTYAEVGGSKEIHSILYDPAVAGGIGQLLDGASDVLAVMTSTTGDPVCVPVGGCCNTSRGLSFSGDGECIVYVK